MPKLTAEEIERQKRIEANRRILESIGLEGGADAVLCAKPKAAPKPKEKKASATAKRKATEDGNDEATEGRSKKASRVDIGTNENAEPGSIRRSGRLAGKKVDYANIEKDPSVRTLRAQNLIDGAMDSAPRTTNKRTQNPKQYGSIPGVEVGAWWETREECSNDAIHAPWVGGIAVGPKGAYSVALSGGYDDDVDLGVAFTYTGSGGRDLKGTKDKPKNLRTAPQSSDQTFENHFNKALKLSAETGKPVRVIRGYKLHSPYAPWEGYRYDGLYRVEKAWQEIGMKTKYLVCKFAFKRLSGQPPLQKKDLVSNDEASDNTDGEDTQVGFAAGDSEESSTQLGEEDDEKEFE